MHIIADVVSHDKRVLDFVTDLSGRSRVLLECGKAKETKAAKAKKEAERVDETKFKNYFEFSTPVANVKPHQALAINRGERLKVLSVKVIFLMIVPF